MSTAALSAPANAGVYGYGAAGTFPDATYQANTYWIDVVVMPTVATLEGTGRSERLHGKDGDDVVLARGGGDVLVGRGGYDVLRGQTGKRGLWLIDRDGATVVLANVDNDARAEFELVIQDGAVSAADYVALDFLF